MKTMAKDAAALLAAILIGAALFSLRFEDEEEEA